MDLFTVPLADKEKSKKHLTKKERIALRKSSRKTAKLNKKKQEEENLDTPEGIEEYITNMIESNVLVSQDRKIDDRHLPLAKNVVEFFTDRRFSAAFTPVAKQIEIGINYLTDYCPKCSDVKYAMNIPTKDKIKRILKRITLLEHGRCPKCRITRTKIWKRKLMPRYSECALLIGQRGFKSSTTAMLMAYLLHRLLKLQDPPRVYGLLPNTSLNFTFTALTFNQAKLIIYREFYNFINQSPWFQAYHEMLDGYEHTLGQELYKFTDTLFHYRHRGIIGQVAAPDMKTGRGFTRIAATIDELGWFTFDKAEAIKINADEVYITLKRSLLTARAAARRLHKRGFFDVPTPMFANISSPSNMRDKICQLVQASRKPKSEIFSRHYSTFEMNPYITPEDLAEEREDNYAKYKRDYLAIPPMAANPFISERRTFKRCVDRELNNIITLNQVRIRTSSGVDMLSAEYELDEDHPYYDHPKILALDAGLTNNSFAGALICAEKDEDEKPIFIIAGLFEVIPVDGMRVDFSDLYTNLLLPICKDLNVKLMYADRWNSVKLLQDISHDTDEEVEGVQYSPSYGEFIDYRDFMMKGKLVFPRMEIKMDKAITLSSNGYPKSMIGYPVAHFAVETVGANDVMGKKIDKGDKLTDDLLRAAVLGIAAANDTEALEMLYDMGDNNRPSTRFLGLVAGGGTYGQNAGQIIGGSRGGSVTSMGKPYGY